MRPVLRGLLKSTSLRINQTPVRKFSMFNKNYMNPSISRDAFSLKKHNPVYTIPVRFVRNTNEHDDKDHTIEKDKNARRSDESYEDYQKRRNRDYLYYFTSLWFFALGASYLAVPLYAAFCQVVGIGGTVQRDQQVDELNEYMRRTQHLDEDAAPLRPIQVVFQATVHPSLKWTFEPCQSSITLRIGETALAFYKAKNNMDKPFIGVSTYNVLPPQAGVYFNKIQCFCFDEQRLRAGEEMDMPIFFFLDPAMADDWRLDDVQQVTLSYTFFPAGEDEVSTDIEALNKAIKQKPSELDPKQAELAKKAYELAKSNITTTIADSNNTPIITSQTQHDICPMPPAQHNPTGK